MPTSTVKPRNAWEDRFRTPEVAELLALHPQNVSAVIDYARERLSSVPGVTEVLAWQGLPWRWTLVYRHEGEGPEAAWSYLSLQPSKPSICIPLTSELLQRLPLRKLSKSIRDGLRHSTEVAGTHWPQWELLSKSVLDDAWTIISMKTELLAAKV